MVVKWSWLRRHRSGAGSPFNMGSSGSLALFMRFTEPLRAMFSPMLDPSSAYVCRLKRFASEKPLFLNRDSTADNWVG